MRSIDPVLFAPYEAAFHAQARLSDYSWSLCGGPCAGMFLVENGEMLRDLACICIRENLPVRVFGGLSNVLVSDKGWDGIVLLNRKGMISHTLLPDGSIRLTADSGVLMSKVVRYCTENSISGFEWAAGLPGTVGGAVYGNAGAFGTEIADIFAKALILNDAGETDHLYKPDMDYSYRSSILKNRRETGILLSAEFNLAAGSADKIQETCEAHQNTRKEKQPWNEPSLGSVFRNPEGETAGKLIQAAGLKGMKIGKASVSMKHANFITTEKGVCSTDYYDLILTVQKGVLDMFGIYLEPEIEILGFGS